VAITSSQLAFSAYLMRRPRPPLLIGQSACVSDDDADALAYSGIVALDAIEREELCDLMRELGSAAPTLLGSWTTNDLAAHLVIREHDLPRCAGAGDPRCLGPPCRKALTRRDYADLLTTIGAGPPRGFFRIGWVRRLANLNEFFVHDEDVRRANGLGPRINAAALDEALWRNVRLASWFLARRLRRVGLELEWAGTGRVLRARRGEPIARLSGLPGELLLYLFGRQDAAKSGSEWLSRVSRGRRASAVRHVTAWPVARYWVTHNLTAALRRECPSVCVL
jgi:uncharacterized protein (TIGR03085 family)